MPANAAHSKTEKRLYIFGALLVLWALAICLRLVQLQVVRYGEFHERAQKQQQRTFEMPPRRGDIFDRNGNGLAMSVNVDSVFAVPSEVPDQPTTAALLGRVLKVEPTEILARMKASHAFCWVARKLDAQTADRVRAMNLRGIYFQKEPKRFYPKRELASQVLGYVGMDDAGLSGIEHEFDGELRGIAGRMSIERDARGRYFGSVEHQPEPGENLVLTLDEKIQYIAERELDRGMAETHAISGTVIVENPHTGEILALANRPNFNPNDTRHITPAELKDHAVTDIYEPGSTFKIVTIAAALEEHLTRPEEPVDCQMGSIVVAGMRIRDSRPHGVLDVTHVIAESSDVGAIKIGMRLGDERFDRYVRAFGFGSPSGIELPAETRGMYKPISRWSKVSMAAMSMGQEIGISAVQLAGLISTIANDGIYVAPRIVAADVPNGHFGVNSRFESVSLAQPAEHRVISPATAGQMKKMLRAVVLEGTGTRAQLDGYTSAGKTGTAQKVDPATHAYSKTKYVGSFAGFAPLDHPAVVIAVILDSAVGLHQGGQVSAPIFRRIAQQVLPYLNVPHDLDLDQDARRRTLLAKAHDEDMVEGSPDRLSGDVVAEAAAAEVSATRAEASQEASRGASPEVAAGNSALASVEEQLRAPASAPVEPKPAAAVNNRQVRPAKFASAVASASGVPLSETPSLPATPQSALPQGSGNSVVVDVDGGQVVPSFLGKPMRAVIEQAQQLGFEVEPSGSGVAREQSPPPGTRIAAGQKIAVRFAR